MRKTKKLLAVICAISMIFSVMAGFTTVNAAGEGITLDIAQTDETHATVTAKYTGLEGVSGFNLVITTPDGATVKPTLPTPYSTALEVPGTGTYGLSWAGSKNTPNEGNVLATFEITLTEALKSDFNIQLGSETTVDSTDDATGDTTTYEAEKDFTSSVTMRVDPNATPAPTAMPQPSSDPSVTAPSVKEPVNVTKGIDLAAKKVSDTEYTVTATYVGYPDGVSGFNLVITTPDGATVTPTLATPYSTALEVPGTGTYGLSWAGSKNTPNEGNVIATYKVEFATAPTEELTIAIAEGSSVDETDDATGDTTTIENPGDLKAAWVAIGATGEVTPDSKLSEVLTDPTKADLTQAEKDAGDKVYVALNVTKADGTPADYDTDYVAYYNGVKLSKQQLDNYLTGTYGEVSDAIRNITFKYNTPGVKYDAQIVKVAADGSSEVVDSGTSAASSATPTPVPAGQSKITVTGPTSIKVGAKAETVVKSVAPAYAGGKLTVTLKDGLDYVTGTGVTVQRTTKDANNKDVVTDIATLTKGVAQEIQVGDTIRFVGALASGKEAVILDFDYEAKDTDGNDVSAKTVERKITVTAASTGGGGGNGGSGSGNTSSGGGAIANGNLNAGTAGTYPGTFKDLGDAAWATEAITGLASAKIVSGYEDGTFRPNGSITRAEYAQILINAIGKQGESADTYFNDVPTDAWFYHNVAVAAQYGIVSGYGDGNFGPYDLITREQMALMTLKAAQVMSVNLTGAEVPAFADDAEIADWSRDAVYTLANVGIINGMGDGTFAPKANATRAQAATIIYNTFVK